MLIVVDLVNICIRANEQCFSSLLSSVRLLVVVVVGVEVAAAAAVVLCDLASAESNSVRERELPVAR